MANPLKQLAGETAIYGLSSILARILNFLFVTVFAVGQIAETYCMVAVQPFKKSVCLTYFIERFAVVSYSAGYILR